jgi:hypothetical protein
VHPLYRPISGTESPAPSQTCPAAGTLDTDRNAQQIPALAHAIDRYFDWRQRQVELRESRRKPNTPEAA